MLFLFPCVWLLSMLTLMAASVPSLQSDMTAFYNTHPLGKKGTCSYLSKAVITLLLEGEMKPSNDDPCTVS